RRLRLRRPRAGHRPRCTHRRDRRPRGPRMSGKIIVCRCEDVALKDVENAVAQGYTDIEEVKRYTGFGSGPCQGKECQNVIAIALARLTGERPTAIAPLTSRAAS